VQRGSLATPNGREERENRHRWRRTV